MFVSDKRLNGSTDQAQIFCGTFHDPREGFRSMNYKGFSPKVFDFCKVLKICEKITKLANFFCNWFIFGKDIRNQEYETNYFLSHKSKTFFNFEKRTNGREGVTAIIKNVKNRNFSNAWVFGKYTILNLGNSPNI